MDAGDAGNGGVGWETIAGCLIEVHFYRAVDGVAIHTDLGDIDNHTVFDAGMRGIFQRGNSRHEARSPLAWRTAACILLSGLRLSILLKRLRTS